MIRFELLVKPFALSKRLPTVPQIASPATSPVKPGRRFLAGQQFLHGAFFDLALLGEKLLQGFDEGCPRRSIPRR